MRTDLQAANLLKARYGAQVQDLTVRLAQARSAGDKATATTLEHPSPRPPAISTA